MSSASTAFSAKLTWPKHPFTLFGSKDALVIAYVESLDEKYRADWEARIEGLTDPHQKVLAFFDKAIEEQPDMEFRGSHFLNAAGEYPRPETDAERGIVTACMEHRNWMHSTMTALLTAKNGYPSATQASQLLIFLDGGMAGARLTREISPLKTARELAIQLLSEPPADYSI